MNRTPEDQVMLVWLSEVIRRQRGENTGLRAISLALEGIVSACCGATPTIIAAKSGRREVCAACKQPCEWQKWHQPHSSHGRGDGIETMCIRETRSVNRDGEDRARTRVASRFVAACRLIEPRPPTMRKLAWERVLLGWGTLLRFGAGQGTLFASSAGLGAFTRWHLYEAQRQGRAVVAERMLRSRRHARVVLGET